METYVGAKAFEKFGSGHKMLFQEGSNVLEGLENKSNANNLSVYFENRNSDKKVKKLSSIKFK